MSTEKRGNDLSRRGFLGTTAAGAATMYLGGSTTQARAEEKTAGSAGSTDSGVSRRIALGDLNSATSSEDVSGSSAMVSVIRELTRSDYAVPYSQGFSN